jgi:hypothetical protein
MKKNRYSRLLPHHNLGRATLTVNNVEWDVSRMNFFDMIITHEPEIRAAEKVVLKSSEVGTWQYKHDTEKWVREEE